MLCCMCFVLKSAAQTDTLTTEQVDAESYNLYLQQNWKELAQFTESMLNHGTDFYYLRLRGGIAYFQLEQYRASMFHFEKAVKMNPFETTADEYLYWCYMYTGRFDEALKLSKKFSDEVKERTNTKNPKAVSLIITETGIKFSDNTNIADHLYYGHWGISHRIKKDLSVFHGITYLQQKMYWGNYNQGQYYVRVNIPLKKNWQIAPALNFMQLNAQPYNKGSYLLGSLTAQKNLRWFNLCTGISYSNIFNNSQVQGSATISWFPLSSNKLQLSTTPSLLATDTENVSLFWSNTISYIVHPKLSLSLQSLNGKARNFNESNGYLVNNTFDAVTGRYTAMATYTLAKKWDIYSLLQYEQREEFFTKSSYNYSTFIIGFKYKP